LVPVIYSGVSGQCSHTIGTVTISKTGVFFCPKKHDDCKYHCPWTRKIL